MTAWLEGSFVADMAIGELRVLEAEGRELLVARTDGGFLVADNRCPHMGGRLSKGTLDGSVVTCHLHHSRFDLVDGSVVAWTDLPGPVKALAQIARPPRPLRVYESRVRDDGVLLVGPERGEGPT